MTDSSTHAGTSHASAEAAENTGAGQTAAENAGAGQTAAENAGAGQTAAENAQPDQERRRISVLPFDRALAELQQVVARLEAGNQPLEEAIALYEQGVLLHEHCARLLNQAELRVQRLVDSAGGQLRTIDLSLGEDEER